MDLLSFLGRSGFLPHGTCLTWSPTVLWTMVLADSAIALAYFSIPLAILSFTRQRGGPVVGNVALLFSAFIFACGTTHVMDVWTMWQPDYGLQAVSKAATALISVATAVMLWFLIPRALRIPSAGQLQGVIGELQAEVGRRRTVEQSLDETEQNLAITLDSIGAGFITTDRRGHITRMNAVAEATTGRAEADAAGHPLWQVFQPEHQPDEAGDRNPVDDLIAGGSALGMPVQMVVIGRSRAGVGSGEDIDIGADTAGIRTAIEVRAALVRATTGGAAGGQRVGDVRGMTIVFRDLTALQFAQSEATRLAAIVESSHDAIIGKTLDDQVSSWNPAAEAMFGWTAAEMVGQPIDALFPPERADEDMAVLAQLSRGDRVAAFDTQRMTRSGRRLDVSVAISPIRDGTGRIAGASKILRDISDQKAAEAALRESEARLILTLEAAQLGEWSIDLDTGTTRHSLRHDRCFGYDEPIPDWTAERFYELVHPEDRVGIQQQLEAIRVDGGELLAECRVIWPDRSVHWIRINGSVMRPQHAGGGVGGRMLGVVSDITGRKRNEAASREAERLEAENRQILEASRAKSLFLANMSHELRTPLNAIIGFSDLLRAGAVAPDSAKHAEFLGHIGSSGRHLLNLINDVLDLSKVEAGKFSFYPADVVLPELVQAVRETLAESLRNKRIELRVELDPAVDRLTLDPGRLKQALYNYLSNAIKFTPEGGLVTVRARPEGPHHVHLEVEDNGIGIAASDLPALFQDFQQLDAGRARQHQGTGLGLSLTRQLVELQGGRVGVRSQAGSGSVFHLVLPRKPEFADTQPGRQRLLLIGPTLDSATGAAGVLAQAGFSVDEAATGASALEQAASRSYDAFTLDLLLPDQHGLPVLERIRRDTANREATVLGMTLAVDADRSVAFAIADVLTKPLNLAEVEAAMARVPKPTERDRPPRVAVVDDETLSVDLMVAALERLGVEAHGFADGPTALQALDALQPDAMVVDLIMPGMDGLSLLDALRRMPQWQQLPVFIWTRMLPSDDEYAQLKRSASRIVGQGGGELNAMLDRLCRWRPPLDVDTAPEP